MAIATSYLGLVLPAYGEFYNSWYKPNNANFVKLDAFAASFGEEVNAARGNTESLNTRLSVGLNDDGSFKTIPEIEAAKPSSIYGYGSGSTIQSLQARLELGDKEAYTARQGLTALIDSLAFASSGNSPDCLVSGPTNPITATGAVIKISGQASNIIANINGYLAKVVTDDTVTLTTSGDYYLTLTRNPLGTIYTSVTNCTIGTTTSLTQIYTKFSAQTSLIDLGVKPGHILSITGPSNNICIGRWVVYQTHAENSELLAADITIVGAFPVVNGGSGFSADFVRPMSPTLGFTAVAPSSKSYWKMKQITPDSGTIYIGSFTYNSSGSVVSNLVVYPYQARYAEWSQVTSPGNFTLTIPHNLGFVPKRIKVYASQNNDFSSPLEELSTTQMSISTASISSGSQTLTYTPPILERSVIAKVDSTSIYLKNATPNVFYYDYSGSLQTSGHLYVVAER